MENHPRPFKRQFYVEPEFLEWVKKGSQITADDDAQLAFVFSYMADITIAAAEQYLLPSNTQTLEPSAGMIYVQKYPSVMSDPQKRENINQRVGIFAQTLLEQFPNSLAAKTVSEKKLAAPLSQHLKLIEEGYEYRQARKKQKSDEDQPKS